jgi:copper chaperone CopZ
VTAIEQTLSNEAGVIKSEVDLESKSAVVESNAAVAVLIDTIKAAGFDATESASEDPGLRA